MRRLQHQLRLTRHARGVGLLDGLIALAILAFGLLGMTRMQTNLVRQASDSQARLTAAQFGDELLNTALVDVDNAACYTLPAAGECASAAASARTTDWDTRVKAALPGTVTAASALADEQLTVTLTWTGRTGDEDDEDSERTLQVTTDVRP